MNIKANMIIRPFVGRRGVLVRWCAAGVALLLVAGVLVGVRVLSRSGWRPPAVPVTQPVAAAEVPATPRQPTDPTPPPYAPRQAAPPDTTPTTLMLPAPSAVHTPGAVAGQVAATQVGSTPLWLGRAAETEAASVTAQFAPASVATGLGVASGLVWSLRQAHPTSRSASVQVQLDTTTLAGTSGGNLDQRLDLVALPACALSAPQLPACRTRTPVTAFRDGAGRLVATVTLPATTAPSDGPATAVPAAALADTMSAGLVLAADSAPAGSAGTYAATPLQFSDTWSHGGASGGFSYAYPLTVPPALGGAAPEVSLSYSSQSVDGMTASTNAQSSWVGVGWSYQPGYIERAYQPCSQDGIDGSGDTCWAFDGAQVSLDGPNGAGALVRDDASGDWHISSDPGARVQLLTASGPSANGAYQGEYWVITDTDGSRFYYGAGHLPAAEGGTGIDPATNAVWTQPVYCPHSGDACYSEATGTDSFAANMAYRWNLDYVV
ncbi:MAG TPA: hypothetical protein VH561_13215, partial [Micromonosporaceae bacterium]